MNYFKVNTVYDTRETPRYSCTSSLIRGKNQSIGILILSPSDCI